MTELLDQLASRVLLCDGAMGTQVQAFDLDLESDFQGQENCAEILNLSRPDVVDKIHRGYLEAGSDIIQTNTFGGSPLTLAEFGLAEQAHEINRRAAEIAVAAAAEFTQNGNRRFVLGSIGPGTRLPSLGHVDYDSLEAALQVQCAGLVAGGVDGILIETCQDPLQIKAAVNGARLALAAADCQLPILVQVTVETTGTLLVGSEIAAAATVLHALEVDSLGLNCATGPQEMAEHVRWLSENWPKPISVQPNAGLPELVDGQTRYPLGPDEIAHWLERFVREDGINLIGGCCGTTPQHIAALRQMLGAISDDGTSVAPAPRPGKWTPSLASLYSQVPYRQENAYLSIGERCNANGSKKFRELLAAEDWDACVAMGREQAREGSHTVDLCTAYVGRDEVADIGQVLGRMRGSVPAPVVIDSTELPVIEAALKLYGGKAVINSINFEDGEQAAAERLKLARRFGAAVIALTIDESGMAKETGHKLEIAHRLHDFACQQHGLPPEDLLIDPLTFTVCTGNEDDRRLALNTLDAIETMAAEIPACQIILGVSNVSFGLNPPARHVLNSVFLAQALERGMTGAIVHLARVMPLHKIPENERKIAEDLILDRRGPAANGNVGYDPLTSFMALFEDRKLAAQTEKIRPEAVEERLTQRIVDGDRQGLEDDLDEALAAMPALDIINSHLLAGMKVVGELFGSGQMQLPFVLQSAETMKTAVAYLEPHMDKTEDTSRGTVVLATVRGDVHDIGKNLVDIILTNNGYEVVNLGIKQPIAAIMQAARDHDADAIGMSGLLVKSTVIMRENLEELTREGLDLPVFLGGAALTRRYVEEDCRQAYGPGRVAYARDAFGGLDLANKVAAGSFDAHVLGEAEKHAAKPKNRKSLGQAPERPPERPIDWDEVELRRDQLAADAEVPEPPFLGARALQKVAVEALLPYLNERLLYQFHWGFRKAGRDLAGFRAWAEIEVKPILTRLLDTCAQEGILQPQACYGYWQAAAQGDDLVLFDESGEAARFALPRQPRPGGLCLADFVRDVSSNQRDVVGLQLVTLGQQVADTARQWFADDRYQDYLYLHGLGVELTEALAEYVHKRIRGELGFGHEDARESDALLRQGYRGARYSFGYPACPNLTDQRQILKLLGAERIGVVMAEADQLHPEQSTSALVIHHPQAKYFSL
ncbi:MAG: methionine synthase [Alphaproteobacteria bacterium]|jgi:5-methyltetrahydrofolate--homocysteine methyltransferase|nr:methionine synthase [Rhodospirillaceae bacterium]MDP6405884.1 methionine synthase [Alphaproteobacteria bacterium]